MILVGVSTASGTTVSIPSHQAGDLIAIYAFRGGAVGAPTLPPEFTPIQGGDGTTCAAQSGWKTATGTGDTSGTWTNANELVCHVYRAASGKTLGIGASAAYASTTSTVNYPAIVMGDSSGTSWVAAFTGCRNKSETINTAPSGMTNQSSVQGATYAAAGFDTNGAVSSWSSTNVSTTGTATGTITHVFEILELGAGTNPNLYQHRGGAFQPAVAASPGNPFTLPLPNASIAGNTYVLAISYDNGLTPVITDSNGNTWPGTATVATRSSASPDLWSSIFVLPNCKAGLNTVTVTFGAPSYSFQWKLTEYYWIDASAANGTSAASFVTGPTLSAGSFTPGDNNAGGGNIVYLYACKADQVPTVSATRVVAGANFTLLDADSNSGTSGGAIGYSMPSATEHLLQVTSASINPALSMVGDSTDHYNVLAVALKLNSANGGPPPSSGIFINKLISISTGLYPAGNSTFNIQVPAIGKLRCIVNTIYDPGNTISDSEGNVWQWASAAASLWYLTPANAPSNSNLMVSFTGGGATNSQTFRFYDLSGCDTASPYDSSGISNQGVNAPAFTMSPTPTPVASSGIVICNPGLGQGPGLSVTSPVGAVWDLCLAGGGTDVSMLENADLCAHYLFSSAGAETWSWTIAQTTSTNGGWIVFKAAPAVGFNPHTMTSCFGPLLG